MEALRPGHPVGEVYDGFDRVMTAAGMREHTYNACGYSLGAAYGPSWVDPPWFYQGNEVVAVPNMVFFPQVMLMNSDTQRAMTLGQNRAGDRQRLRGAQSRAARAHGALSRDSG